MESPQEEPAQGNIPSEQEMLNADVERPPKKPSLNWGHLFLEGVSVMFGVLFALAVTQWRENRNNQHLALSAMTSIREELTINRKEVQASLAYHQELFDKLRPYFGPDPLPAPSMQTFHQGFVKPALVFRTAWDSASETGALQLMRYEDVLISSKAYAVQKAYASMTDDLGPLIYEIMLHEGIEGMTAKPKNLAMILGSLIYKEQGLLETYERALADLAKTNPKSAPALKAPTENDQTDLN